MAGGKGQVYSQKFRTVIAAGYKVSLSEVSGDQEQNFLSGLHISLGS